MLGGRQAKVGQLDGQAVVRYQDVFRLQVAVVDPNGVTKLHGIQQLDKGTLG